MKDRVPLYPGRVTLTPVPNQENTFDMVRADQPEQPGDPLNKNTLLKDATAALFGLGPSALPDDVLALLGKYNQEWMGSFTLHWWKRRTVSSNITNGTERDVLLGGASSSSSSIKVFYSTSYEVDYAARVLRLVTPSSVAGTYGAGTGHTDFKSTLPGKYVVDRETGEVCFITGTNVNQTKDYDYAEYCVTMKGYAIDPGFVVGEWEYVQGNDATEYPAGISGGYEYVYLGIPLDNALGGVRVETGEYIGTGSYSESAPNILTFDFEPKMLAVYPAGFTDGFTGSSTGAWIAFCGMRYFKGFGSTNYITFSQNTVSWYSTAASSQANTSGSTYYYTAIG